MCLTPAFHIHETQIFPLSGCFPLELRLTPDSSSVVVTGEFWPDFESSGLEQGLQLLIALGKCGWWDF